MSAESSKRVIRKGSVGQVVLPQVVSDRSIIDSVTGFIHEVVPQAYVSGSSTDNKEVITWAKFEQADISDQSLFSESGEDDQPPSLLLVLGYGSGVQVWSVASSGEAREVLSWSQGAVRTLRVLPTPEPRLPLKQDIFKHKRPLVALVDNAGPGPQFCSVGFISLKDGDQVKSIKFKNQVWDVLSNRRSVVISLAERIAVFDALTLEDRIVVTTCYPNPDVNPVALGTRWLAYADRRMVSHWRSMGGCQSEGPQSVTATMMHAAKFLGKGLRDLSETVANSFTGSGQEANYIGMGEPCLKGIVTIIDIDGKISRDGNSQNENQFEPNHVLAHFNAHCEPVVALEFDPSGMLLLTADKRGYRFHLFRINTHPCGPTFASVQHLYTLYRGETTARIQDVSFSNDSRWVAVSSMRGTTHVFPITPYGGPVGVRTHTTPHVVNKLSRFHRSAGLTEDGRNSPVLHEGPPSTPPLSQRTPTFFQPTTVTALAQIRCQPQHMSEDANIRVAACFAHPRANIPPVIPANKGAKKPVDSLFVMSCNGSLVEYELEPKHVAGVTKDRICDDTPIEITVEAKGEWVLLRPPYYSALHPPLSLSNPLLIKRDVPASKTDRNLDDDKWLSQVEIVTHAGPHRRLWMGPQFTFKTYSVSPGSVFDTTQNLIDVNKMPARSNPVNMPLKQPLIIESGSNSSLEISPKMVEMIYKSDSPAGASKIREDLAEAMQERGETRLREDLADAMMEGPRSLNRTSVGHGQENIDDLSTSSYDSVPPSSPSPSINGLVFPNDTI
uniref:BCAS3 WD40 domain-containing protein n=1 Tax=Clastoptera arizonana TaxID=38151 RepID=A0A1B6E2D0_9HEMI